MSAKTATEPATDQDGTVRRVLQRVVLPADRDMDVLPLYVDRDKAQLDLATNDAARHHARARQDAARRVGTGADERASSPQAILGRHRLRVTEGERV